MNFVNIKHFKHLPSNKHFHLTKEGLDELKHKLDQLREERFKICNRLRKMDPKEKSEHILSSDTVKMLEINDIEVTKISEVLRRSEVVTDATGESADVKIGSTVSLQFGNQTLHYTLVDPIEADPMSNKISNESPLGQALLGKRKNALIRVINAKGREYRYRVLGIV